LYKKYRNCSWRCNHRGIKLGNTLYIGERDIHTNHFFFFNIT
jgi:hypothetical protein